MEDNMRLAGIEKGGFYPIRVAEAADFSYIPTQETRGGLLDLCAGEGEIAKFR
jgi:hypothetical protein